MPAPQLPKLNCQYGAPMGRADTLHPGDEAPKLYLRRVRINSGGYDSGGAYWGLGAPLYRADTADGEAFHLRARSREAAKAALLERHPEAKFYR